MTPRILLALPIVALGCATVPKPPELESLERLRSTPEAAAAQKSSPDLVSSSDKLHAQSTKRWQSKDIEESRRDALMSAIKLKTAMALAEQGQSRARSAAAEKELTKSEEEYGRLAKELTALTEQIALMQKLVDARQSASKEQQKTAARDRAATAEQAVNTAELAIKTADIVDAATHAKAEYASATEMLSRAKAELKQGNWSTAQSNAEMAKDKAEQAAALAKRLYRTQDEALGRDAAMIPGITVRLERRGHLQRLVLPLRGLFRKTGTIIASGKDDLLDQVAALAKKYPTYPIHVIGHTAKGGRATELIALSLARAQSVSNELVSRGIEDRRMKVSGQGANEPEGVGNVNNRVEVVFIYE